MKLLVLGGTRFLGRAVVDSALARNHDVTLFNRGRSGPGVFPGLETLIGDRAADVAALAGRHWDAAIDTCGYVPRVVRLSASALRHHVRRYVFVSSISVYADSAARGLTEDAPCGTIADPATEEVTGETYGPLKALCENVVQREFAGRALVVRPGLLVGPHDPTGRFTYWVERIAAGGEVLAPGEPGSAVQFIDVRDLAGWIVTAIERSLMGTFHLSGPAEPLTMGEFLAACRTATGSEARLLWAPDSFLLSSGVLPWAELPLWVPDSQRGFLMLDLSRARSAGLTCRPLDDTVADTLEWARGHGAGTSAASASSSQGARVPGLNAQRENGLIAALKALS